ncbi:MAG: hypothetical protein ABIJ31_11230 [Pseudomonadota bacterium]
MKFNVKFFRLRRSVSMIQIMLLAFLTCMLFSVSVMAESAGDLAKSANNSIRNAERAMYGKKIDESAKLLEEARATLDALKTSDSTHSQLKSLELKYEQIKKQVDKKLGSTSVTQSPLPAPSSTKTASSEKLPAGVSKRLKDINRELTTVERYLTKENEASIKQADYQLNQAKNLFDEIDKNYGNQFDPSHPDYAMAINRFNTLKEKIKVSLTATKEKKAGAEADKTAMESQSAEWISKFQAYLSYPGNEGHDPDLLVYIPGTSEPEKFDDAQKRYNAFKDFYDNYKGVAFPNGKNWKLETLADQDAPRRLADFEKQFADRVNSVASDVEKQISQAMAQLEKDKAWEKDSTVKPPLVDKKWMVSIEDSLKKAQVALGEDSPIAVRISKSYEALVAKDTEYRKIRADRTFLSPDIYDGNDKKELLNEAGAIISKEKPGSKIMKVSIYKGAWEEKIVEGWTDTTKTRWEKKTFKQINAQVAARDSSGVYLYTLFLAKDKTSGGWGKVYGHVMFSDLMAEKNVEK